MAEPEDDQPPGVPEWVVTYGDMMSLLLTFFIMLVSLSELKSDDGKLRAALDSIREAFGATEGQAGVPGQSLQQTSVLNKRFSQGNRSEGGLERASRKSQGNAGPHTTAQRINHGAVITLGGPTVFPRQSTELNAALKHDLDVIAHELANRPNLIVVRGHTAREPVSPETLENLQKPLGRVGLDKLDISLRGPSRWRRECENWASAPNASASKPRATPSPATPAGTKSGKNSIIGLTYLRLIRIYLPPNDWDARVLSRSPSSENVERFSQQAAAGPF